jgi:Fe-S-cluster containining protein
VWCKDCSIGKGCNIYETRPKGCRDFQCEWLKGYGSEDERPDRLHIILDRAVRDPSIIVPEGVLAPDEMFQIWEVSEGALDSKGRRVMQITKEMADQGLYVLHIPLHGLGKLFHLEEEGEIEWDYVDTQNAKRMEE